MPASTSGWRETASRAGHGHQRVDDGDRRRGNRDDGRCAEPGAERERDEAGARRMMRRAVEGEAIGHPQGAADADIGAKAAGHVARARRRVRSRIPDAGEGQAVQHQDRHDRDERVARREARTVAAGCSSRQARPQTRWVAPSSAGARSNMATRCAARLSSSVVSGALRSNVSASLTEARSLILSPSETANRALRIP